MSRQGWKGSKVAKMYGDLSMLFGLLIIAGLVVALVHIGQCVWEGI